MRADLYRSGPLAGVARSCDEARGRVYKGGPLPLWTTCRHHIITKEKYIQSYLMLTFSRRPVRHARPWSEWNCHLGDSSVVGGEGSLDVLIQHHPASPRELAGLFPAQELSHAQTTWEHILWL